MTQTPAQTCSGREPIRTKRTGDLGLGERSARVQVPQPATPRVRQSGSYARVGSREHFESLLSLVHQSRIRFVSLKQPVFHSKRLKFIVFVQKKLHEALVKRPANVSDIAPNSRVSQIIMSSSLLQFPSFIAIIENRKEAVIIVENRASGFGAH